VDAGCQEAAEFGVAGRLPDVDVKVTLIDGAYHEVDSSELAFKIAGSMAFKKAAGQADPALLEPVMAVEVRTPDEYMGDVIGDLNSRRGHISGHGGALRGRVSRRLSRCRRCSATWGICGAGLRAGRTTACSSIRMPRSRPALPRRSSPRREASS